MQLDLARLLEEQVRDTARAQKTIEEALLGEPTDPDVISELERLAGINNGWATAASSLAQAVAVSADLAPDAARDAYVRLASWYESRLGSLGQAETALLQALAKDPENVEILRSIERLQRTPGRERDLVETLRRLAKLELEPQNRRQIFREAKTLAEHAVQDLELTEKVLRQLLEDDEADIWALEELTRLRELASDWAEVMKLLLRRSELTSDGSELARLQHEAAEIAQKRLGDTKRAVELYETLFDMNASDRRASAALREIYGATKKDKELRRLLERLIDVAGAPADRSVLRLELARLQASGQDAEMAIETLRAILDEEPGHADAVVLLSQLYEQAGQDEQLAELLGSQIELAKERKDSTAELSLTVRLGEIYESKLGDSAKAIETYEAVLARDAGHAGALESLARLFEKRGELAKAAESLDKLLALRKGAEAIELALRVADLYGKLKDDAKARRALEQGLTIDPNDAKIRGRLAATYDKLGDFAKLAELLAGDAEAAAENSAKIKLYREAANLYTTKQNDAAAAALLLEKASALAPADRELLLALCDAYSAAGRGKDAAAALEKVVASFAGKRSKELAAIHQRLSRAYLAEGDKVRAIAELDQAFKIDPGSVAILKDLGTLSIDMGDLERAQKTFRALLLQRLDPSSPITKGEVFYFLGDISNRMGDKPKAIQMLERSLENEPNMAKAKELLAQLKG
jgi:tetratricopeptide (TPR) repeat protein